MNSETHTTIEVELREQYGMKRLYVIDDNQRRAIELITSRKTLLDTDIRGLKALGFQILVPSTVTPTIL